MKYSEFIKVYFPFINKYSEVKSEKRKKIKNNYEQILEDWVLYILSLIDNFIDTNFKRYGIITLVRVAYNYVLKNIVKKNIKSYKMVYDIQEKLKEILSENYRNFDIIYSKDGNIESDLKIIDTYARDILIYIKRFIELNLGKNDLKELSRQAFRKYYESKLPKDIKSSGLFYEIVDLLKILLPPDIYGNFWEI